MTVVNDGSPDHSRELLRKYEGLPNVQIIDQENRGVAAARNAGLRHIRGEYVMFVDSDDSLRPGAVEALMNTAKEHNCDIVQGGYIITTPGRPASTRQYKDEEHNSFLTAVPWASVMKAKLFEHVGFPEGYWYEDSVMTSVIFELAHSIRTSSQIVYNYNRTFGSVTVTSRVSPKAMDSFYVKRRLLKDCRQLGLIKKQSVYEKFLIGIEPVLIFTTSIPNRNVWYEVFWQLVALKEEYFPDSHTERDYEQPLEDALVAHDYKAYLRAILNILCPAPK